MASLLVAGALAGRPWPEDDPRVVNAGARGAPARMTLTPAGLVRHADAAAIASAVARSAAEPLGALDRPRVREHAHPDRTRVFIDRSRGGNRIKAANYRPVAVRRRGG